MIRRKEYAWETLESLAIFYRNMYRAFRKAYKWAPWEVDRVELNRLLVIYDELQEDSEKHSVDEEDFE